MKSFFTERDLQAKNFSMDNITFVTRRFDFQYTGGAKIRQDMNEVCRRIGIHVICLSGKGIRYFLSLAKLSLRGIILLMYPNVPTIRCEGFTAFVKNFAEISLLWIKKKLFHWQIILFVQDLPIEQINAMRGLQSVVGNRWLERILFSVSDIIGVIGPEMEEIISQYYPAVMGKSVYYYLPPYFGPILRKDSKIEQPIQVAFIGDLIESRLRGVVHSLIQVPEIQYNFYGPNGDWLKSLKRTDIRYRGVYSPEEIGKIINMENHLGLLLYDPTNEEITRYMSMAVTIKFMTYIFSGLPIITFSLYKNIARMVMNHNLGLIFDKPDQIPYILFQIDSNSYRNMTESVTKFAESIISKDYFKQFIKESLNKLLYSKVKP